MITEEKIGGEEVEETEFDDAPDSTEVYAYYV